MLLKPFIPWHPVKSPAASDLQPFSCCGFQHRSPQTSASPSYWSKFSRENRSLISCPYSILIGHLCGGTYREYISVHRLGFRNPGVLHQTLTSFLNLGTKLTSVSLNFFIHKLEIIESDLEKLSWALETIYTNHRVQCRKHNRTQ